MANKWVLVLEAFKIYFFFREGVEEEVYSLNYFWKLNISSYLFLVLLASIDCLCLLCCPCCRDKHLTEKPEEGRHCFDS